MLLCAVVLVCAFNPALTDKLAAKISGIEATPEQIGGGPEGSVIGQTGENSGTSANNDLQNSVPQDNTTQDTMPQGNITQGGVGVYIPPAQEEVISPESVKDKNGYEPVKEKGEEIADSDAENLQQELGFGETGDDITFDERFYPYYGMLDSDMQTLYRQIYANAMELTTSFAPIVPVTVDQVKDVFEAVYNDHPELFWVETGYSCKYMQNGKCIELTLQYYQIAENLKEAKNQFDSAAQAIIKEAEQLSDNAEKEQYVHDVLIEKVDYHEGTAMNQSAYSALVNGRSVCAGYARAFQYIMMELGIPCYYCTGYSGADHAWNIVQLEDDYYNVDVTWDDTNPSTYDYFNKTDADYAKTHMRKGMSVYLPACNGTAYRREGSTVSPSQEENKEEIVDDTTQQNENLINPNPQKPLTWYGTEVNEEEETKSALEEAGLTEDEVLDTLEEYYADCLKQMTEKGVGQQQFTNVIPQSLWQSIERVYSDGSYQKGYVEEALKQMKMENFAIQLQTERLSGGYYRLYHNISTW